MLGGSVIYKTFLRCGAGNKFKERLMSASAPLHLCWGNVFSRAWFLFLKSSCRAVFISVAMLVPSIIKYHHKALQDIKYRSSDLKWKRRKGLSFTKRKASVPSGYAFQACHADFFPFPRNADVVSQPVNTWKNGSARYFCSPKYSQMVLTESRWKFIPIPKATQNLNPDHV